MWSQFPHHPTPCDDDWEDQPRQGRVYPWGLGVVLPLGLLACGAYAVVVREVTFGTEVLITLHGANAVALGSAAISAGLFVHFHYFWGNIFNQAWFAVLGKIVAACGFVAALAFVLIRSGVLGIR